MGYNGSSVASSRRGAGQARRGQRGNAAPLKLPPLQKSASEPSIARSSSVARMARTGGVGQSLQEPPAPASPAQVAQTRESRRAMIEVLSNPDIKNVAAKYYNQQLPDKKGRLGFKDLRDALRALNQHFGVPIPTSAAAEQLFKRFDFNGDGDLNFEEFFELFVSALRRSAFDPSTLFGREIFISKEPGKVWDNYHRVKTLGQGSFGAAHLGKHKRTNEDRVIKAVEKSKAKVPVEDIEKEIMVMREMDHPHIIRLYEWYEGSSTIYLVIDALKGGTLRDALLEHSKQGQPVEEVWSRSVMRQTIEAMAYCHSMRVIHKDLKDENVMLLNKGADTSSEPFVVIIDLGVSEMFAANDAHGKLMGGTPMTMAPEVWVNNFGPKCDVWSAGCILFEMLSGSMPFMARSLNPRDWQALHKYGPPWNKVQTSSASRKLCQEMLTYSDKERPTMKQCLEHKWFGAKSETLGALSVDQLKQLQAFAQQSALKRAVIQEVASKLPMEKSERIVKVFKQFDVNSDGGLSQEELANVFAHMGLQDDKQLQARCFQALDLNHDGVLSFSEFAAGVLSVFSDLLEDRFQELFRRYDANGDGLLSRREFQGFLDKVLPMTSKHVKQSPADITDQLFGKNNDTIPFEDLRKKLLPVNASKVKSMFAKR
eukprot:TRINITY_DN15152_c0_g1_i2.p1 TRINITY_DN15152_c0_g1~~TRINITY_DN15152_c0_g1_i2.p1  ORF type:complete len:654 (+),score=161.47 TRINITY_DN15152_c0_g1_i2:74-2035(+)